MYGKRLRYAIVGISMLLLCAFALSFLPMEASASSEPYDFSLMESQLNTWQYYFCRTAASLALKEYYDSGILPSITIGQAFYEGGSAGAPISILAQNHFGIRAYTTTWNGMVYDDTSRTVYNSYQDACAILGIENAEEIRFWRAYENWEDGFADHSELFRKEEKYKPFLEATDYKEAALQLRLTGYCSTTGYETNLINYIEKYGFAQFDSAMCDQNGIFGLIMDRSHVELDLGETTTLQAKAYPQNGYTPSVVWSSSRPNVAVVDDRGNVTALQQGYTLITATYNNKEACCIIGVDVDAHVTDRNLAVYSKPSTDSDSLGKISRGQPVSLRSDSVYKDSDGTAFYAVSAGIGKTEVVIGYALAKNILKEPEVRISLSTPEKELNLEVGDQMQIPITVHAKELQKKKLVWASSSPDVISTDQKGNIIAGSDGVSIITVSVDGLIALNIIAYVGPGKEDYERIVASTAVNIRSQTKQSATVLGTIRKNNEAWLIEELDNGWFHVLSFVGGRPIEGYSYAQYFWRGEDIPEESEYVHSHVSGYIEPSFGESDDPTDDPASESSDLPSSDPTGNNSDETTSEPSDESSDPSSESSEDRSTVSDDSSADPPPESSTTHNDPPVTESDPDYFTVTLEYGEVDVDDVLNVRSAPSLGSDRVAKLASSSPVYILERITNDGEPTYKNWLKVAFYIDGVERYGYVSENFIRATGTRTESIHKPSSDRFTYDETYLRLSVGCNGGMLQAETGISVTVLSGGVEKDPRENIATGDTILFHYHGLTLMERTAVVKGDVSGDGVIDAIDYFLVKRACIGNASPEGAFLQAALVSGFETVDATDYFLIKRAALGMTAL